MKIIKYVGLAIIACGLISPSNTSRNPYSNSYRPKPYIAENGTYRGQLNTKTYKPKDTYVKPYVHKDGSRVRSYYRTKRR